MGKFVRFSTRDTPTGHTPQPAPGQPAVPPHIPAPTRTARDSTLTERLVKHRRTVSIPRPTNSPDHPSQSDLMRLRLAQSRLREAENLDPGRASLMDLIDTKGHLEGSLRDLIELVLEAWPDETTWSEQ